MDKIDSLLICNSNMFIPTVLTEVLSHPKNTYVVISDTDNIRQFFGFLSIPNVIYHHYGIKGWFDFVQEKRKLWKKLSVYEIQQAIFFHAEFGGMANWLIKKLSQTIPIYYCKIYDSVPVPHSQEWLSIAKIKLREYLYWGVKVDVLQGAKIFPSLPTSFFEGVRAQSILMPIDSSLITNSLSSWMSKMKLDSKCLLLTGTMVQEGHYSVNDYTKLINSVIEAIGPENISSKCHPRFSDLYGKELQLPQIPSFIPGNVLIGNYDYYIGFESTLLVEAAIAGKTAISLIDLFPPNSTARMAMHKLFESRLEGKGVILFPQSIEELISLVA